MDDLYKDIILDRYKNPQNRGKVEDGIEAGEANFLCGDKLVISVKLEKGIIKEAKFEGGGCAISMAAADMLMEKIIGLSLEEAKNIGGQEIEEMLGADLTPARKKCAYLGLEVIRKISS